MTRVLRISLGNLREAWLDWIDTADCQLCGQATACDDLAFGVCSTCWAEEAKKPGPKK
jgi:hypothetical protein